MRLHKLSPIFAGLVLACCSLFSAPTPAETGGLIRESVALTARLCGEYRASGEVVPPDVQRACDTFVAAKCPETKADGGSSGAQD